MWCDMSNMIVIHDTVYGIYIHTIFFFGFRLKHHYTWSFAWLLTCSVSPFTVFKPGTAPATRRWLHPHRDQSSKWAPDGDATGMAHGQVVFPTSMHKLRGTSKITSPWEKKSHNLEIFGGHSMQSVWSESMSHEKLEGGKTWEHLKNSTSLCFLDSWRKKSK